MMSGKRVVAVIPARGGSKGVPRKNTRQVAGKPLIAYTVDAARRSRSADHIVVSSDDNEILETARHCGAEPLRRPGHLATDDAPGVATALHAIDALPGFDVVVLLQPTSPLRSAADIDGCVERCIKAGMTACVSVVEAEESPYWMFTLTGKQTLKPIVPGDAPIARRQDLPKAYLLNGAVYAAGCHWLAAQRTFLLPGVCGWVMPAERSLDIDTESDLEQFSRIILQEKP